MLTVIILYYLATIPRKKVCTFSVLMTTHEAHGPQLAGSLDVKSKDTKPEDIESPLWWGPKTFGNQ